MKNINEIKLQVVALQKQILSAEESAPGTVSSLQDQMGEYVQELHAFVNYDDERCMTLLKAMFSVARAEYDLDKLIDEPTIETEEAPSEEPVKAVKREIPLLNLTGTYKKGAPVQPLNVTGTYEEEKAAPILNVTGTYEKDAPIELLNLTGTYDPSSSFTHKATCKAAPKKESVRTVHITPATHTEAAQPKRKRPTLKREEVAALAKKQRTKIDGIIKVPHDSEDGYTFVLTHDGPYAIEEDLQLYEWIS